MNILENTQPHVSNNKNDLDRPKNPSFCAQLKSVQQSYAHILIHKYLLIHLFNVAVRAFLSITGPGLRDSMQQ